MTEVTCMSEYLIQDTSLTAIANAIRAKGGAANVSIKADKIIA